MKYFVGVDQGGSKTEVLIGDENGILIDKYTDTGYSEFAMEMHERLQNKKLDAESFNSEFLTKYMDQHINFLKNILSKNNLGLSDIYALVSSMAGLDANDFQPSFEKDLREKISNQNVSVYNDMYGAWRGGTDKCPSGVIAIGTGTGIMFFHDNCNSTSYSGNIRLEHQGARALGSRAFFHACFSAVKSLEPTILTEKICEFAETSTIDEALTKTKYGQDVTLPYQFFTPHLYEAALKKDRVALDFVNEVGSGLAGYIRTGIKDLGWEDREVPIVLSGGSFKGNGCVMEKVIKDSLADLPNLTLFQAEYEPVYGALILAYEKYNNGVPQVTNDDIVKFKLKRSLL